MVDHAATASRPYANGQSTHVLHPYAAPPAERSSRSPLFWIGVVLTGLVLGAGLLAGGYFLGQSTRLSDAQVHARIAGQARIDTARQRNALGALSAKDARHERRAVKRAAAKAKRTGFSRGKVAGYSNGHSAGYSAGTSDGYSAGESDGYSAGNVDGFYSGYGAGACDANVYAC